MRQPPPGHLYPIPDPNPYSNTNSVLRNPILTPTTALVIPTPILITQTTTINSNHITLKRNRDQEADVRGRIPGHVWTDGFLIVFDCDEWRPSSPCCYYSASTSESVPRCNSWLEIYPTGELKPAPRPSIPRF